MRCLALALALLLFCLSDGLYMWTSWNNRNFYGKNKCYRNCSDDFGMTREDRICKMCTGSTCKRTEPKFCGGPSGRVLSCYRPLACLYKGWVIGRWTAWRALNKCSKITAACKGEFVEYRRRCKWDKRLGTKRGITCPEMNVTVKRILCPCEQSVWAEWGQWSTCVCEHMGTVRTRTRSCIVQKEWKCPGEKEQEEYCPCSTKAILAKMVSEERAVSIARLFIAMAGLTLLIVLISMCISLMITASEKHKRLHPKKKKPEKPPDAAEPPNQPGVAPGVQPGIQPGVQQQVAWPTGQPVGQPGVAYDAQQGAWPTTQQPYQPEAAYGAQQEAWPTDQQYYQPEVASGAQQEAWPTDQQYYQPDGAYGAEQQAWPTAQ